MTTTPDAVGAVLCAGFGTRLSPLTETLPKPLIPFLNTPLVTYGLDHLASAGIKRVGVNLHHLPDAIPPVVDRLAVTMGLDVVYAREWEILGTAGGIRGIWHALGEPDATLVVLNGDSVMDIDLGDCLKKHRAKGRRASLVVRVKDESQPGKVWVDEESLELRGLRDMRHPEATGDLREFDYTGVGLYEPSLLREIPVEKGCVVGDVLGPLMESGEGFGAVIHEGFWAALDNPTLYFQTTRQVLDDPELFAQVPLPAPLDEGLFVFNQDGIHDKAKLAGPLLTGAHVSIERGARVGPYAVLDGVEVSEGARVKDAILYGMGRVEGEWERCIAVAGKVLPIPEDA